MTAWLVIRTKSAIFDASASKAITDRTGLPVYFPRVPEKVSHAGKVETKWKSMFPQYFFTPEDAAQYRIADIKRTPGVEDVLRRRDGSPQSIRGEQINDVRAIEIAILIRAGLAPPPFQPGDKISPTKGAFAGIAGKVAELKGFDRVRVMFRILGGERLIELPLEGLAKIA